MVIFIEEKIEKMKADFESEKKILENRWDNLKHEIDNCNAFKEIQDTLNKNLEAYKAALEKEKKDRQK
jgi:hypothetical protein